MQMSKAVKLFIVTMLVGFGAVGQIRIITLKGTIIETPEYRIDTSDGFEELRYLSKKGKPVFMDFNEVYSVTDNQGTISVVYTQENSSDRDIKSMGKFIEGQLIARQKSFKWEYFISCYFIGASGGFYPKNRIFIAPLTSLAATMTFTIPFELGYNKKIRTISSDPDFIEGYKLQERRNRIRASILGSLAGLGTGAIIYGIRDSN